jgi:putative phosphoesterase
MKLGVVSDTHGYFDPALPELMKGVEAILHAGDVGSMEILDQFRAIAPVQAVRGNVDAALPQLPLTLTARYDGIEICMQHQLTRPQSVLGVWANALSSGGKQSQQYRRFRQSLPEQSQVVIFGHSHEPCLQILEGRLFFNPGSAGKKRFSLPRCCGRLEVSPHGVRATILGLERYNENLPEEAWLPGGP